jgi:hypothetical protein
MRRNKTGAPLEQFEAEPRRARSPDASERSLAFIPPRPHRGVFIMAWPCLTRCSRKHRRAASASISWLAPRCSPRSDAACYVTGQLLHRRRLHGVDLEGAVPRSDQSVPALGRTRRFGSPAQVRYDAERTETKSDTAAKVGLLRESSRRPPRPSTAEYSQRRNYMNRTLILGSHAKSPVLPHPPDSAWKRAKSRIRRHFGMLLLERGYCGGRRARDPGVCTGFGLRLSHSSVSSRGSGTLMRKPACRRMRGSDC